MPRALTGRPDPRGRAFALIHGAGGNHRLWGQVYTRLRRAGVPAVGVDLPGHGSRPGTPAPRVEDYARDVEGALREGGITAYAAAGHSMGGAIVLRLAADGAPGLRAAAAVSTGARLPVDPRILRGSREAFEETVEKLGRLCFARGAPEEVWRAVSGTLREAGPDAVQADFLACDRCALGDRELRAIRVPVHVVCGEEDVLTPPALSRELAAKIPDARLTLLPGCGHMPLLEDPDGVAHALAPLWDRAFPAGG